MRAISCADLRVAEAVLRAHLPEPAPRDRLRVADLLRALLALERRLVEAVGEVDDLLAPLDDVEGGGELAHPVEQGQDRAGGRAASCARSKRIWMARIESSSELAALLAHRVRRRRAELAQVEGQAERVGVLVGLKEAHRPHRAPELEPVAGESDQQPHAVVGGEGGHGGEVGGTELVGHELEGRLLRAHQAVDPAEGQIEQEQEVASRGRRVVAGGRTGSGRGARVELAHADEAHRAAVVGAPRSPRR